jgi:hypothetical protein
MVVSRKGPSGFTRVVAERRVDLRDGRLVALTSN